MSLTLPFPPERLTMPKTTSPARSPRRLSIWGFAVFAAVLLDSPALPAQDSAAKPASPNASTAPAERVTRGHAHNDYLQERPLLEALERGFASIEADVFLRDGQLLIGHTEFDLRPERTLEGMYLQPLRERLARTPGNDLPPGPPLILLIDIKSDAASTWDALHPLLLKYREILSETVAGKFQPRAVRVIISGNRATDRILAARPQLAGIDGRLSDLASSLRADEMPLLSDAWSRHFQWRGSGPMPDEEAQRLRDVVAKAHAAGRLVRFWATPETAPLWQELRAAGVDLIGTDQLNRLEEFLQPTAQANPPAGGK